MSRDCVRAGFDEAGLGPTLGPLVVAGFATRSPSADLLGPLAAAVGPPGVRDGRLEVGDSKKIHTGARKLQRLERTALATVAWLHGRMPATVAELLELVDLRAHEEPGDRRAPWWAALDEALPVAADPEQLAEARARLVAAARAANITPLWYRAEVLSAARINRELRAEDALEGTKNTWATHAVLRLVRQASEDLGPGDLLCWCDKAGGRQAYAEPLRRAFPELPAADAEQDPALGLFDAAPPAGLRTLEEVRARSHYQLLLGARSLGLGFVMGGDRLDPRISWASILAKYLRELVLRAFNRYFGARVPGLRRTAGYPQDARRFIAEVEDALGRELGLERGAWIRSK